MIFTRRATHYEESACKRYTVGLSFVHGRRRYTAWLKPLTPIACFDTREEAEKCCETHLFKENKHDRR